MNKIDRPEEAFPGESCSNERAFQIAVVVVGMDVHDLNRCPWMYFRRALADHGFRLLVFQHAQAHEAFERRFDAMFLHVWQDWNNPTFFDPTVILPIMSAYSAYRFRFADTIQIILNHTDMSRQPYATPYWRAGDPVLYRTPAYDRGELYPFPADSIVPYEMVWGSPCFVSRRPAKHLAGFIGTESGPPGYRRRVAKQTSRVGIGICSRSRRFNLQSYASRLADCRLIVCPRGWGEQSMRHWDTWLSGKPMLTDRDADSVELIPGQRLRDGVHYIVFDEPEQIPSLVEYWTHPSRQEQLEWIAANGRDAALAYDPLAHTLRFFRRIFSLNSSGTEKLSQAE